ncbi:MAG: hypothetical protein ACI4V3_01540 [Faecousia sp.]
MKRAFVLFLLPLILTLSACAVKQANALETIACPAAPSTPGFYLTADFPTDAILASSSDEGRSAVFLHEDYTLIQEVFSADSLEDALLRVTGRPADELELLRVCSFPQEEYRFAWTAAGEEGDLACSAALFSDGAYYYALSVICDAAHEKEYRTVFSDLLTSAELEAV